MPSGVYVRKPFSEETKQKIRIANLGKKHSNESKLKMSLAKKGKPSKRKGIKTNKPAWNTGKKLHYTVWNKGKHFEAVSGSNHWNWKKDRNLLKKNDRRNNPSYKSWRREVWTRDGWKCRINNNDCLGKIEAHHILGWKSHPELRYQINNGITLCHNHHPRKRDDEMKLSPYFQNLVVEMKQFAIFSSKQNKVRS